MLISEQKICFFIYFFSIFILMFLLIIQLLSEYFDSLVELFHNVLWD